MMPSGFGILLHISCYRRGASAGFAAPALTGFGYCVTARMQSQVLPIAASYPRADIR